jgi:hypothetical protein
MLVPCIFCPIHLHLVKVMEKLNQSTTELIGSISVLLFQSSSSPDERNSFLLLSHSKQESEKKTVTLCSQPCIVNVAFFFLDPLNKSSSSSPPCSRCCFPPLLRLLRSFIKAVLAFLLLHTQRVSRPSQHQAIQRERDGESDHDDG